MRRVTLLFCVFLCPWRLLASDDVEGGRSPNGEFDVVNVDVKTVSNSGYPDRETHFEIHDKAERIILSELSFDDLNLASGEACILGFLRGTDKVLWRKDSRFVAILVQTSKFATQTFVFHRDGNTFQRIKLPEYEPYIWDPNNPAMFGTSDNTHREPVRWSKSGDLVLDITMGYHTKSDGGITGYFADVRFMGKPLKAIRGKESKVTDRD